jgi:hypothetical protein
MSRGLCCLCDRAGQIEESRAFRREGWGVGHGYSEVPRWQSPLVSIKDRVVLTPVGKP